MYCLTLSSEWIVPCCKVVSLNASIKGLSHRFSLNSISRETIKVVVFQLGSLLTCISTQVLHPPHCADMVLHSGHDAKQVSLNNQLIEYLCLKIQRPLIGKQNDTRYNDGTAQDVRGQTKCSSKPIIITGIGLFIS